MFDLTLIDPLPTGIVYAMSYPPPPQQPPYGGQDQPPQQPPQQPAPGYGPPQPYPGPPQYQNFPNQPQYPGQQPPYPGQPEQPPYGAPQYPGPPQSPYGPPGGGNGGGRGKTVAIVVGSVVALAIVGTGIAVAMRGSGSSNTPVASQSSVLPLPSATLPSSLPSELPSDFPSDLPSALPSASSSNLTYNAVTLKKGQCYSDPAITFTVDDITVRNCTSSHDGQVTAVVSIPSGLTTDDAISSKADSVCRPINSSVYQRQPGSPDLSGSVFYPVLDAYRNGDHTGYCVLTIDVGGTKLTAPLR